MTKPLQTPSEPLPAQLALERVAKMEEAFRRRVIAALGLIAGVLGIIGTGVREVVTTIEPAKTYISLGTAVFLLMIPLYVRWRVGTYLCTALLLAGLTAVALGGGFVSGGMSEPGVVVLALLPLIGTFCAGRIGGALALMVVALAEATLLVAQKYQPSLQIINAPETYAANEATIYFVVAIGALCVGVAYETSRRISETFLKGVATQAVQAAKMASLGEMAAGIAHEINNPLAIIVGKAHHLRKAVDKGHIDPGSWQADLIKIEQTAARIAKIVRGLKAFSRHGDAEPMVVQSLGPILSDVMDLCSERFKNAGVELRLAAGSDMVINCRSFQIAQVLVNLLGNAFDAVQTLQAKWVELAVTAVQGSVHIAVTDSGPGIPPDIVAKMMQPFFSTKATGSGTGLGLSISLGIAAEHQGVLRYDGQAAHTRFVLELPVAANPAKLMHG